MSSSDGSPNPSAAENKPAEECARIGREDTGKAGDDVKNTAKLESEQPRLDVELRIPADESKKRTLMGQGMRAAAERLTVLVESGRRVDTIFLRGEELELARLGVEADGIEKRHLVAQELRAAAENMRLQVQHGIERRLRSLRAWQDGSRVVYFKFVGVAILHGVSQPISTGATMTTNLPSSSPGSAAVVVVVDVAFQVGEALGLEATKSLLVTCAENPRDKEVRRSCIVICCSSKFGLR